MKNILIFRFIKVIIGDIIIIVALLNALPIHCCNNCALDLFGVVSRDCVIYSIIIGVIIYFSAVYLSYYEKNKAFIFTLILIGLKVAIGALNRQTLMPDYIELFKFVGIFYAYLLDITVSYFKNN